MNKDIEIFSLSNGISQEVIQEKWSKKNLLCKCGDPKTLTKSGRIASTCGKKECHSRFGVARPGHSEFMKRNASTISGCFQKGKVNTFINSVEWKKKALTNKGVDIANSTDEDIEILFKTQLSTNAKSLAAAKTIIANGYVKWKELYDIEDIDIENLDKYSTEQIRVMKKVFQSIKSIEAGTGVARRYKRTLMTGFKYNFENQESVFTRSSYETTYIKFFEKNHIWWCYETLRVRTPESYYVPDIVFHYKGYKYILEIKGFLLDESKYFSSKIIPCINYANKNGYKMLFTYDPKIETIEKLISQEVTVD